MNICENTVLRGQIFSFHSDPFTNGIENCAHHWHKAAMVINETGRICWRGDVSDLPEQYADCPQIDYGEKIIAAGFIDAHLHYPQCRMLAAYASDLLDWLKRYTFIEEQRYGDSEVAEQAAGFFLDQLSNNGITSCLAFSTIHPTACEALFKEAEKRNMALITGRTMMDRSAPPGLCDTPQSSHDESVKLINTWHGRGRLQYAISPRFAVTSSEAQLELAGALAKANPGMKIQTHLSENEGEIATVARDFPWSKDYTDVYDHYGLLREQSFFAHAIHLSERELARLSESNSAVVHCPTSNNFLGSGHFKLRHTADKKRPVKIGLGCDIGGGTSYSPFDSMRDAFTVSQLVGQRIHPLEAFYLATLGNAHLLELDNEIGNLDEGKFADLVILDPCATDLMKARNALSNDISDVLFSLIILGDDRAIFETWIAGKRHKTRKASAE